MPDPAVPPEAVRAATEAVCGTMILRHSPHELIALALAAAAPAIRAAERERYSASFRGPVAYLIGLVDGMRKMYAADEDDWARYRECFRQVRDELAVLLPENDDARPEPPAPGTAAAIAATERERIRRLAVAAGATYLHRCPPGDCDENCGAVMSFADLLESGAPSPVTGDGDG